MSKIRILTISKPYVASAYRNKLIEMARHNDVEIGLIAPQAWGSQRWEDDQSANTVDFPKIWTRQLPIFFNGKNHFHVYSRLDAAVREFRPDIFNVEEEHYSLVTWQAFRIAKKIGAISTFYTWQNIFKKYPPPFSWIESYVFRHSGAAFTGNSEASDVLRRKGYQGVIREIPQMGVEFEHFAPVDLNFETRRAAKCAVGLDSESFWICFAGRLVEEKGVQDLIEALTQCPTNVKAVIIGDGEYSTQLRQLAGESLAPDRVVFVTNIRSRQVADYFRAVDVLCLPSRTRTNWKEQFGRVLVEAMASGAVCIGSSSGEIPNVIGDVGLVFPESDYAALADAIKTLARDADLTQSLREAAWRRVQEKFTNRILSDKFLEIFRELHARRIRDVRI